MKMVKLLSIVALVILTACNGSQVETVVEEAEESPAREFWNRITALCGQAFEGELVSGSGRAFAGQRLVMHVLSCSDDVIHIPFNVGDNLSRTWILTYENDRILLKHDHRIEDGSDDPVTMYGGWTSNAGRAGIQFFPADEETRERIGYAFHNIWWITVSETAFTYNLRTVMGTNPPFTVSFDHTNPVEIPERSWGYEDFVPAQER